ncbi:MAG: leucine-rich repeat protein, partial [Lachnospiraceae bacterium]|nr:leucine-rich repeat protein [Lachnospiraceae bacterium]
MKIKKRFLMFFLLILVGFASGERVYASSDTVVGEAFVKTEEATEEDSEAAEGATSEAEDTVGEEPLGAYEVAEAEDASDDIPAVTASTQTWTEGVATVTLEDGVLTVSGSGAMTDYTSSTYSSAPWYSYRTSITSIVIGSGITHIGDYAFMRTYYVTSISLPASLKTIGEAAFYQCYDLTSVTIPDSVQTIDQAAFANCSSLQSVTLGSAVQTIGSYAFQNTEITSLTIPASVTSLGTEICYNCSELTSYVVASGNSTYASANGVLFNAAKTELIRYPQGKTDTSYTIPSTVKTLGVEAFYMNSCLTSVTIPSSVTTIGDWVFTECTSLKSLTVPDSVTSLGDGLADSCTSLTTAKIGNGIETLEYRSFYNCTALTSVTLGSGLKTIYNLAFYNCEKLSSVNLPQGLESINSYAFYSCTSLKSLTIPDSVTYIGANAFYQCTNLTVTYPSTMTEMEDGSYLAVDTVTLTGTCCYSKAYEVLTLVNKERAAEGLSALTMDKDLLAAAMQRAAEINIYFSHTRPSNLSCSTVSDKLFGENIAVGQTSASSVMNSWMNSSGHKANILGSSYQTIGIGCFTQGDVTYWVQIFGTY